MNTADKRQAWTHIKKHSPHTEIFIRTLKKTFGTIEMVSYQVIKNPPPSGNRSFTKAVLADTTIKVITDA